jgi:hypothetical protein
MGGDGAERAAAEAAAHNRHRVLDHFVGGDRFRIRRVRPPGVGQVVDAIHFRLGQWQVGRIGDDRLAAVKLNQGGGVERICVDVDDPRRLGKRFFVGRDFVEGRERQSRSGTREECHAAIR